MKKWFFKTGILIVFMLAAGVARAALVTVSGSETWDGTANPHAADGVVLTTNGTTYTYAIPDGMTITGSGVINLGQNNVTFTFANGGLHLDSGRYIDADTKTLRYGARTFTLEMGTNNITGSGDIKGTYSSAIGVHSVTITGSGGVSLNSVDLRNVDAQNGSLSLHVGGAVSIGSIDVSAPSSGGGNSGSITVRAPAVTVSNVNAYAYSGTPGAVRLDALAYPYFGYQAWATNAHANTLTLNGVLRTKGTTGSGLSGGSAVLDGVNVVLGAGFNTNFNATGTFVLRCGLGGASHFTDNSGKGFAATQLVSHVEHPHAGARPQIIVFTNETWDGTANPHAADGVTLDIGTKTYALPTELYVTQSGAMNMGQPAATSDVKLSFTNGGFRMDSGANMTVNVGRYVYTKLTLDLGGYSILGAGTVAGGTATGPLGSRSLVVTNAGDVSFSAVQLLGYESANGSLQVTCTGLVEMTTVNTSDLSGGGDSAGNITVRGARVDVRDAYAYCARTDLSTLNAGNIMLEALKPPEFNPSQPINTRDNTLVVRGLLDTCGPRTQNLGNVTLRGAVVTLDPGFQLDLNSNGVFTIYAGDREPHSTYFIDNTTNLPFAATHNVQLKAADGTLLMVW
jgi:hypothetical protein